MEKLAQALEINSSIKILKLADNDLGDESVRALLPPPSPPLRSPSQRPSSPLTCTAQKLEDIIGLTLCACACLCACVCGQATRLAKMLAKNTSLTDLNLSHNPICNKGALQLVAAIRFHPSLTSLGATVSCLSVSPVSPSFRPNAHFVSLTHEHVKVFKTDSHVKVFKTHGLTRHCLTNSHVKFFKTCACPCAHGVCVYR